MFGEKSTEDQADYAKDAMELLIKNLNANNILKDPESVAGVLRDKEVKNENKHLF